MNPLDNVIWHALTTRQTGFAESFGEARRFIGDVGPLAAFRAPDEKGYESLAGLAGDGGTLAVFQESPWQPRSGWSVLGGAALQQMVWDKANPGALSNSVAEVAALGAEDSADMVALATLTKPGPFGRRTHELGSFFGVRVAGELVAMAGERMKVPGYTEVSAVCTRPGHTGHGYAAALMSRVMRGIIGRGETPFLHVKADNDRAIGVYERLGFRRRQAGHFVILRRE